MRLLPTWRWTRLDDPDPTGSTPQAGWGSRFASGDEDVVHLVVNAADGCCVGRFGLDSARSGAVRQSDIPLRRASSAVASADRLVVAGIDQRADRPGLCVVASTGSTQPFQLDTIAPDTASAPVGAWPQLALDRDGVRIWVVWASGSPAPYIHTAALIDDTVVPVGSPIPASGLLGLQAASAKTGGLDILWQAGTGSGFQRVGDPAPGLELDLTSTSISAATLTTGAVVWPTGVGTVGICDTATGRRRDLTPPAAPEGGNVRIASARLVRAGETTYLVWSTQPATGDAAQANVSRSWISELPSGGDPEAAAELPLGTRWVIGTGHDLLAGPADGAPLAWRGFATT